MGVKHEDSDRRLITRTAAGDADALAELYDRHGALCRRRAFGVLRNSTLADDAVQEAFLDLWKTAGRFDAERASVVAWLCVLVHRRAVDLARRESRHLSSAEEWDGADPASYTAEETLVLRIERVRVQDALAKLSESHRELVVHAYYGGLTQSQLAERFGLPLGTVKSRMFEALARLASILGPPTAAVEPSA